MKILEVFIPVPGRAPKESLTLSKLSKGSKSQFNSGFDVHAKFHDQFERLLRDEIDRKYNTFRPVTGAVSVEFVMSFHFPKSVKLYAKDGTPTGNKREYQVSSPDIDKVARCILDSMTGIVYLDDKQVSCLEATKVYVPENDSEGVSIQVKLFEQNLKDLETQRTIKPDTAFNLYKAREAEKKSRAKQRRANRKARQTNERTNQ